MNLGAQAGRVDLVLDGAVVDRVGYGTGDAVVPEGGAAPAGNAVAALVRRGEGCQDSDDNAADFVLEELSATRVPRGSASAENKCPFPPVISCGDATLTTPAGSAVTRAISASDPNDGINSIALAVLPPPGVAITDFAGGGGAGQPATASLSVASAVAPGTYPLTIRATGTGAPSQTADCTVTLVVTAPPAPPGAAPIAVEMIVTGAGPKAVRLALVNRGPAVKGGVALRVGKRVAGRRSVALAEKGTAMVRVKLDRRTKRRLRAHALKAKLALSLATLDGSQSKTVRKKLTLSRAR